MQLGPTEGSISRHVVMEALGIRLRVNLMSRTA